MYKSPDYSPSIFKAELEELFQEFIPLGRSCIVLGDFNLCLKTFNRCRSIYNSLISKGFRSLLDLKTSTTNMDTHIDWAFSNINNNIICARTFELMHSHHNGISVSVQDSIE